MGSGTVTDEVHPPITPMRTASTRQLADLDSPAPTPAPATTSSEEEKLCVTPKSERYLLKPALACPPAPRKPPPRKRKPDLPARGFFVVSRDLTSVFVTISDPVKKKLRVG